MSDSSTPPPPPTQPPPSPPAWVWALPAAVLLGAAAGVLLWYVGRPHFYRPYDFAQYWSAGRANAVGKNPYDPRELIQYQRASPRKQDGPPVMMWNPPYTLAAYMPVGALLPHTAWAVWLAAQVAAVLLSCRWLWRVYGGPAGWWWVPYAVAVASPALVQLADFGQNTGLILLGLAGFVFFERRGNPYAAGVFVALTALKPNILLPFGLVLVLHATTRHGWKPVAAGAAVVLVGLLAALATNPAVVSQYREALGKPTGDGLIPVAHWQLPLVAYRLRDWAVTNFLPPEQQTLDSLFWVQFVPVGVACAAAAVYWFVRRKSWDWAVETPRLVWASVLLAPYGGWVFDLTVLLVPAVQAAAWVCRAGNPVMLTGLAAAYGLITMYSLRIRALQDFIWVAPALFGCYLAAGWVARRPATEAARA